MSHDLKRSYQFEKYLLIWEIYFVKTLLSHRTFKPDYSFRNNSNKKT